MLRAPSALVNAPAGRVDVESERAPTQSAPARRQGTQLDCHPFVRLNVDGVQKAAALRYHT
jgi:hypothetical protein